MCYKNDDEVENSFERQKDSVFGVLMECFVVESEDVLDTLLEKLLADNFCTYYII